MRVTVRGEKAACTGCGACVSVCPKGAIAMRADAEGFLYPAVDGALCIGCDLCEKRCPSGKTPTARETSAYGAQAQDAALRRASSSGGVFSLLAKDVLARGGVVFGAAFDEAFRVEHIGALSEGEIAAMRGSKYVQSDAAQAIGHALALLERGVPVLFSGTPCQISGLYALTKDRFDDLLLTVDFVCHGVPSPGVFASYLQALEREHGRRITAYTFRDKRFGWKDFSATATFEDGTEHTGTQRQEPFLYGFLQNLYLRPSCAHCEGLRADRHEADITLADLWGAQEVCPERDDDTGLSLVIANSQKGRRALERCEGLARFEIDTQRLLRFNPSLAHPPQMHRNREKFFKLFAQNGFDASVVMKLLAPPGKLERIVRRMCHLPAGLARRVRALLGKR